MKFSALKCIFKKIFILKGTFLFLNAIIISIIKKKKIVDGGNIVMNIHKHKS